MSVYGYVFDSSVKFNVLDIYAQKFDLADSIAKEAVRAMTETYLDMILEEQIDRRLDILEKLKGVDNSAIEYMDCVMNDLHSMVRDRMEKMIIQFSISSIMYNEDGELSDVDIGVSVK